MNQLTMYLPATSEISAEYEDESLNARLVFNEEDADCIELALENALINIRQWRER